MATQVRNVKQAIAAGLPSQKAAFAVIHAVWEDPTVKAQGFGNHGWGFQTWVNSTKIRGVRAISFTVRESNDQTVVDNVINSIIQLLGNIPYRRYTHNFKYIESHDKDDRPIWVRQQMKGNCIMVWYASNPVTVAPYGIPRLSHVRVVSGPFAGKTGVVKYRINWGKRNGPDRPLMYGVAMDYLDSYTTTVFNRKTNTWEDQEKMFNPHEQFLPHELEII